MRVRVRVRVRVACFLKDAASVGCLTFPPTTVKFRVRVRVGVRVRV